MAATGRCRGRGWEEVRGWGCFGRGRGRVYEEVGAERGGEGYAGSCRVATFY